MKRNLFILLIALAVLLAACGGVQNESEKQDGDKAQASQEDPDVKEQNGIVIGGVRITEAGTVTGKCSFIDGDVLYRMENDKIQLLDLNGKESADKLYDNVERLVGDGVVIVSMEGADIPQWGVVNSYTGDEIVPCEAVDIRKLNDRYLLVNYYTGAASEDDYYSFYSDGEIITYYGYGKVLDLEREVFVPGLEVTDQVTAAGDMLYVDRSISEVEVFDPEGKSQGVFEYLYAYPNSGISLQAGSNGVTVYDGSFQKAGYVTGNINSFDTIDGVDDMLIESVPGRGSRLVDLDGEEISDFYYWIGSVSEYGFHAGKEYGGPSGYVGMDGTELVPFSYDAVYFVEPGYLLAKKENNYNVYSTDGKKLNTEPVGGDLNECRFYTENGFFAPDTGKTVELTRKQYLGYGLIEDTQDAYTSTIYCARTGEIVFEDVEACICIGENIYIWDGENEVYNRYILSWA